LLLSIYAGIKPAVIALIALALVKLWKKAIKGVHELIYALIAISLCFLPNTPLSEILILLIVGLLGIVSYVCRDKIVSTLIPFGLLGLLNGHKWDEIGAIKVFFTFFKVGSILYGSGYVLFAYLEGELVDTGLLSLNELMDSVAVGQFTPGPVLSTSTFIGYLLEGPIGAVLATLGVFLPSFLFVIFLHPFLHKLKKINWFRSFLTAVSAAAVALMAYVLFTMSVETLKTGWIPVTMTLVYLGVFMTFKKLNPAFVVIVAGFIGWMLEGSL